ncbi:MAG: hypothetical protein ABSE07_02765 [Methanoregula sp.]
MKSKMAPDRRHMEQAEQQKHPHYHHRKKDRVHGVECPHERLRVGTVHEDDGEDSRHQVY